MAAHNAPRLFVNGSQFDVTCGLVHNCIPVKGPGGILYDGNITILSVSGRYWPEEVLDGIAFRIVPWISYLDFPTKSIKFAKPLPKDKARYRHCTVAVNQSTLFIFGGLKKGSSEETKNLTYDGYFLRFPDFRDPNNYVIIDADFANDFPCGTKIREYEFCPAVPPIPCALRRINDKRLVN